VPPIPPAGVPIPPGGATASAAAKREEKARKHASQSAYAIRPSGSDATDWFFPAVGAVSVLALLLIAGGVRPRPGPGYAWLDLRGQDEERRPRRRR
jgi:hypothetical protein